MNLGVRRLGGWRCPGTGFSGYRGFHSQALEGGSAVPTDILAGDVFEWVFDRKIRKALRPPFINGGWSTLSNNHQPLTTSYHIVILSHCGVHRVRGIHKAASSARRRFFRRIAPRNSPGTDRAAGPGRDGSRAWRCAKGAHRESRPGQGKARRLPLSISVP